MPAALMTSYFSKYQRIHSKAKDRHCKKTISPVLLRL
jgi:hypothetical protein